MTEFSDEEAERVRRLVRRRRKRAERREAMYEAGDVERTLASFFSGLAGNYESVGIGQVHFGDVPAARASFERAADYYHRSAARNKIPEKGSLASAKSIYVALLAGSEDELETAAEAVRSLGDVSVDPDDPNADRLAFSRCLAGSVVSDVSTEDLETLTAINSSKPEPDSTYGDAILTFSRGVRDEDVSAVESGIESMLEYHREQRHPDGVFDRIMAVQPTALYILARLRGFEVRCNDPLVPPPLVERSLGSLS